MIFTAIDPKINEVVKNNPKKYKHLKDLYKDKVRWKKEMKALEVNVPKDLLIHFKEVEDTNIVTIMFGMGAGVLMLNKEAQRLKDYLNS